MQHLNKEPEAYSPSFFFQVSAETVPSGYGGHTGDKSLDIRLGMFANHSEHIYALCFGLVVQGSHKPKLRGDAGLVVYADDFVACFQYKEDAEFFYQHLVKRMGHFGLEMEESKSRLIKFGRNAQKETQEAGKKADTFDFLGFTHYCSTSRNGKFRVRRKTSRKKFRKKCKEIHALLK